MSEELCPSSADTPVPLPFFVRTANQVIVFPPTLNLCYFCKPLKNLMEHRGQCGELPEQPLHRGRGTPLYIRVGWGP